MRNVAIRRVLALTILAVLALSTPLAGQERSAYDELFSIINNREDDLEGFKLSIPEGFDINRKGPGGKTLLLWAAGKDRRKTVKFMIRKGADLNAGDDDGNTPLHAAAAGNIKETARLLVMNGAEIEARTNKGYTPLMMARTINRSDFIEGYNEGIKIRELLKEMASQKIEPDLSRAALIVPGKSAGDLQINMSREEVERILGEPEKTHQFKDGKVYYSYYSRGTQMLFTEGKVSTIFLYSGIKAGSVKENFVSFKGKLANGLSICSTYNEVVKVLGEPEKTSDGYWYPVPTEWLGYPSLGISFDLVESTREFDGPVVTITIFPGSDKK